MKPSKLTARWYRWRRIRYGRLGCQNVELAYEIADAEACLRRKMTRFIGLRRASEIPLACVVMGESISFGIKLPAAGISEDDLDELQLFLNVSVVHDLEPFEIRRWRGNSR